MVRNSRFLAKTVLLAGLACFGATEARADTLVIVGVAVDKAGQRMSGALVRLYATSNQIGTALAEDRTSERGIFSLYRTNIAGDIGDLYVVYEGESDKTAAPLKVSLRSAADGLLQSRTADLIILSTPAQPTLSTEEAAEQIAAITQTQTVLVGAGISDQSKSAAIVTQRAAEVMAKVPQQGGRDVRKLTIDKLDWKETAAPIKGLDVEAFKRLNGAAISAISRSPGFGS
ncbi:MAG TPA: hypothetical protein VGD94_14105 [Vicinamibacterales bacterium]